MDIKNKKYFKVIFALIATVIFSFLGIIIYFYTTYIDEIIENGCKYGFCIGDAKENTFANVKKVYFNQEISILYPIDARGLGPLKKYDPAEDGYELISNRKSWKFYYKGNFFNFIELKFSNDKLTEIYRHRQYYELP